MVELKDGVWKEGDGIYITHINNYEIKLYYIEEVEYIEEPPIMGENLDIPRNVFVLFDRFYHDKSQVFLTKECAMENGKQNLKAILEQKLSCLYTQEYDIAEQIKSLITRINNLN